MPDPFHPLLAPPGIHRTIERRSFYREQARYAYLVTRIGDMQLTRSTLVAEAEDRVLDRDCTWSELVFTDLFGPDLKIVADLAERIERLETNIGRFQREARALSLILERTGEQ